MEIRTPRLNLQQLEMKHAEAMYAYRSDAKTNQYQGWIPYAVEDCKHFIKNRIADKINEAGSWFQFAILLSGSNTMVGDLGIHFLEGDGYQAEIGCTIALAEQNKGYASEAIEAIIDYLFAALNKHRIVLSIDPNNVASAHLATKLGFRKEAHFRESYLKNGIWHDDVVYALLAKEWANRSKE